MNYAANASATAAAGIFALGSMAIHLPANTNSIKISSPTCTLQKQYNVFAVQPHMHQLGTSINFQRGAGGGAMQNAYTRDPWVFGAQPIDQIQMTLNAGDLVNASCLYNNTTPNDVTYGESTKDEMCFFVLFYTPFDRLDGCLN
jgi:hypothetical protein